MQNCFRTLSIIIISVLYIQASAQNSPYELGLKKDLILYGIGTIGQTSAIIIGSQLDLLSDAEVGLLDANDVNRFDRKATEYYSLRAQDNSDIILYSSYAYPFLFLLDKKGRDGFLEIGVLTGEAFLLNASITSLVKLSARRVRPLAYNPNVPFEKRKARNARLSFFSGHTSSVAVLTFFSAKVFNDYYPESKLKPYVWSAAAVLPAATGYFRVRGGKHFPTDVIVGYVVGALIGVGIPHIHKKKDKDERIGFSVITGPTSVGINMSW